MTPVRLGILGCGAIAQVQHLPNLASLREEFSVEILCDASPSLARGVAEEFHVPRHTTDYQELLDSVDAVLLCHTDPKTAAALAAFEAGKHVFIEKPVCFSLEEADAMLAAARTAGTIAQTGYMKVYDPAFELVRREVAGMRHIRYAQINHLHTDNSHHLAHFRLRRAANDLPAAVVEATRQARAEAIRQAIGEVPSEVRNAFSHLSGSMIHDLYGVRHLLSTPTRVVSTELWNDGWGISTLLEYASGARCVATWVELREVRDFKETLEICADDRRVLLSYPTGFARGILSTVEVQGLDAEGRAVTSRPAVEWENPFTRELRHFHACITRGEPCRTPLEEARLDVALIIDIIRAYLDRR